MVFRLRKEPNELPSLALSVATLSAVGFSLVLSCQIAWMELGARTSFTLSNVLGAPNRGRLLLTLGVGIVLPALVTLLVNRRRGTAGLEAVQRWASLSAPLSLLFVLPGLFLSQVAESKPLFSLVVLAAFGLAFRALVTQSLRSAEGGSGPRIGRGLREQQWFHRALALARSSLLAPLLVFLAAAGYAVRLGRGAVAHHRLILSVDGGAGVADNVMSNLVHGQLFRAPAHFGTGLGNYLSVHADYCALLFTPIYRLRPGVETLLWLQASVAAFSVVPLYLLAQRLLDRKMAVWACLAFLSLSPLHGALLVTFSWMPAFCLFSFTLYYAVISERWWLVALSLPALLASSEAGPLGVFALGVFLIVSLGRARLGVLFCVLASLLFSANAWLAQKGQGSTELPPLAAAFATLFSNPVYFVLDLARATKLTSMLHALSPLGLLPLLSLHSAPLLLPGLIFTSSSTEFWPAAHSAYPLSLVWVPGCLLTVLVSLHRLRAAPNGRPLYLASLVTLSLTLSCHSYDWGALLRAGSVGGAGSPTEFQASPASTARYENLQKVVRQIPAEASVVATPFMLPFVSNRKDVFDASRPYREADYVLLSSLELSGTARGLLLATFEHNPHALVSNIGEFYLFRRGPPSPPTAHALRTLGLSAGDAAPQHLESVDSPRRHR